MSETRTIHDPFLNKPVEISNRLTDRLRGKYACGPTMPSGEPEFGWRQHEVPPIQAEAAAKIEQLSDDLDQALRQWRMYAENEDRDLSKDGDAEAEMYRRMVASLSSDRTTKP